MALVMVRILVVLRPVITTVTSTLSRAFTSICLPFRYHDTVGVGNPLALQVNIPFSNRDMFMSVGTSNRMGFTGGVEKGCMTELQ